MIFLNIIYYTIFQSCKGGVTDVCETGERTALSCGRDGQVAVWSVSADFSQISLERKVRTKMEWPIKMLGDRTLGFQSSFFHVINSTGETLFSSNCGGGHRSTQFWETGSETGNLLFIKKGRLIHEMAKMKNYQEMV